MTEFKIYSSQRKKVAQVEMYRTKIRAATIN